MKPKENNDFTGGIILIIIGGVFLISNLTGFDAWSLIGTYWPIILIVLGISVLLKKQKN